MNTHFFYGHTILLLDQMRELKSNLTDLVEKTLKEEGLELVDLLIVGHPSSPVIQVFIDREGGVTVSDCVQMNRKLSLLLELEGDQINLTSYRLEVSSPGLDRPLRTKRDFERHREKEVIVSLKTEAKQIELIEGFIDAVSENELILKSDDTMRSIPLDAIEKAIVKLKW